MLEIVVFSLIIVIFGILPSVWYLKRKTKVIIDENSNPNKIIVLLALLLIVINTYLAFVLGQDSIMYVLGRVYFLPALLVLFFSHNQKSRWNVIFYTSLFIFFSILGSLVTV